MKKLLSSIFTLLLCSGILLQVTEAKVDRAEVVKKYPLVVYPEIYRAGMVAVETICLADEAQKKMSDYYKTLTVDQSVPSYISEKVIADVNATIVKWGFPNMEYMNKFSYLFDNSNFRKFVRYNAKAKCNASDDILSNLQPN